MTRKVGDLMEIEGIARFRGELAGGATLVVETRHGSVEVTLPPSPIGVFRPMKRHDDGRWEARIVDGEPVCVAGRATALDSFYTATAIEAVVIANGTGRSGEVWQAMSEGQRERHRRLFKRGFLGGLVASLALVGVMATRASPPPSIPIAYTWLGLVNLVYLSLAGYYWARRRSHIRRSAEGDHPLRFAYPKMALLAMPLVVSMFGAFVVLGGTPGAGADLRADSGKALAILSVVSTFGQVLLAFPRLFERWRLQRSFRPRPGWMVVEGVATSAFVYKETELGLHTTNGSDVVVGLDEHARVGAALDRDLGGDTFPKVSIGDRVIVAARAVGETRIAAAHKGDLVLWAAPGDARAALHRAIFFEVQLIAILATATVIAAAVTFLL